MTEQRKYVMTPEKLKELEEHFKHYQDRGMVKWQGFMLSEHNAQIERMEAEEKKVIKPKAQMSQAEIDNVLRQANTKHQPVLIQINEATVNEGLRVSEVSGWLLGDYDSDGFSLDSDYVWWNEIRHVEITTGKKWSSVLDVDPFGGI